MYSAACLVLLNVYESGHTSQKGEAQSTHEALISFEFFFILHLMNSMLRITDFLCQALQCKTQDILKATGLILSTKNLLQKLGDDKFDDLVGRIKYFCKSRNVDILNLDAQYASRYDRALNNFTVMYHYRVDIFYATIDSQLHEINRRFNEKVMELLVLNSHLNPCSYSPIFKINDICELVNKFYLEDFTEIEKRQLSIELHHYENSVVSHVEYKDLSSIFELCQWLVKTEWSTTYPLVYRILLLVRTVPVSTVTAKRSFSAMNLIKTTIRNKMEADYLQDCMMIYIEKEIGSKFSTNVIIDVFAKASSRRVVFF